MARIMNKGKAAIFTIWFISLIQTNAQPQLWQVAMIGIMFYEIVFQGLETWRRETGRKKRRHNVAAGVEDMRRVENERIYWLKRGA